MGWWQAGEDGGIALPQPPSATTGTVYNVDRGQPGPVWGDWPADILAAAVDEVVEAFQKDMGRRPSKDELRRGLEFCLGGFDGDEVGRV